MKNIFVSEGWVNATEGYRIGSSQPQESFTDNPGELFKHLSREYGRCTSRMYVDSENGQSKAVGWVFVKRVKYQDSEDTYLQETWVTLHTDLPEKSTKFHYFNLQS